ncbi:MAG: sterol desaturase/sphingolipid hydroxylase (fatty acid hydroxylase superfamily) [Kiritimatiellia bacterium]|jgi:sterol desaturase/sphingolipid hydroxylase (fatty acid hydroxylase superfamily)
MGAKLCASGQDWYGGPMKTHYNFARPRLIQRLVPGIMGIVWFAAWWSPFGQAALDALLVWVPYGDGALLAMLGLSAIGVGVTWTVAPLFHQVDRTGSPKFIAKYKIQDPFDDPRRPSFAEAARVVLRNQVVLALPALVVLGLWLRYVWGWSVHADPWPWWAVPLQLMAMLFISEVSFFTSHRFLHRPWWYRTVHRQHHRFRTSTSIAAQYAHPFEYLVGNVLSLGLALALVPADMTTMWFYGVLVIVDTHLTHSGYNLPFGWWAVHHDLHHYSVNGNFGAGGFMDRLFGSELGPPRDSGE